MSERLVGYILLGVGVLTIVIAAVNVYMVFTSRAKAIEIVNPRTPVKFNLNMPTEVPGQTIPIPLDLGQSLPIADTTNKIFHLMLMGFMATIGARLAGVGTNLLRPIIVKATDRPEPK